MRDEIIGQRTENTKTFDLGDGKFSLEVGHSHYKDNYADVNEQWKETTLVFEDNKITKAPYTLQVNGLNVVFTSKKTGTSQTISLDKIGALKVASVSPLTFVGNKATLIGVAPEVDVSIEAGTHSVRFKRIIKSKTAALLVGKFLISKIIGKSDDIILHTNARDADGKSINLIITKTEGKLVETLDSKINLDEVKFPIEIDPDLTIQPSDIDTYLINADPNTNFGTDVDLIIQAYLYGNTLRHSILKFDFSALPVGATISAATLSLYYYSGTVAGRIYWAYELTQTAWTETGATWNKYDGTNNWTTPGGDYTTTDGASLTMPTAPAWANWNVLALAQHFQSTHGEVAHFLIIDGSENESGNYYSFLYSNNFTTNLSLRPKLVLTYTIPTNIKTLNSVAKASIKTINGVALANIKTWNGVT